MAARVPVGARLRPFPAERLGWQAPGAVTPARLGRLGAFLDGVDCFDAAFFRLARHEALHMDPQHRLAIGLVWQAIEEAGIRPSGLAGRQVGVFFAQRPSEYAALIAGQEVSRAQAALGSVAAMLPNRISFLLDLRGSSEAIDAGDASSLVAVHRAVRAVQSGECAMAVAGGISLLLAIDGHFDTGGEPAEEGGAAVLLKPLAAAVADGDPIHAVISGSVEAHVGRGGGQAAGAGPASGVLALVAAVLDLRGGEAGVASSGVGGSRAEVALRPAPAGMGGPVAWGALALPVSAPDQAGLAARLRGLAAYLEAWPGVSPCAVARTLMQGREVMRARAVVLWRPGDSLAGVFRRALDGAAGDSVWVGEVAAGSAVDVDDQEMAAAFFASGDLARLARLWTQGVAFDWGPLAERLPPGRAHLPPLMFAPTRCWFGETAASTLVSMGAAAVVAGQAASFWVHGATGDVAWVTKLVRVLDPAVPSFGLEAPGLDGGAAPLTSVEALAAHHAAAIGRAHPSGPLIVGGYSAGGAIAFEIVRSLVAQGRTVSRLVLVDAPSPGNPAVPAMQAAYGEGYVYLVAGNWFAKNWGAGPLTADTLAGRSKAAMLDLVVDHLEPVLPPGGTTDALRVRLSALDAVGWGIGAALRGYAPGPLAAPVATLLVACLQGMRGRDNPFGLPECPAAERYRDGWEALLSGPIQHLDLDCDHFRAVSQPFVGQIAAALAGVG